MCVRLCALRLLYYKTENLLYVIFGAIVAALKFLRVFFEPDK